MAKECRICGTNTIFYYWSSTRNFPRKKLLEKIGKRFSKRRQSNILRGLEAVTVCYKCAKELGYC